MTPIIKYTYNVLSESISLGKCFKSKRLIIANKQAPNLRRLFTTSQFCTKDTNYKVSKCKATCITCRLYLKEGDHHTFKESNTIFTVKYNFTCTSKNLIYVLICEECMSEYIGQTGTQLKKRVNTHVEQIKHDHLRSLNVSSHIHQCSRGRFKIFPFFKIHTDNKYDREHKESYFIQKFKPALNQ